MEGSRLELEGEGSWVTALATSKENTTRLLLVNFNYQSNKSENVPITFTKLKTGEYTYRERFFLGRDVTFKETIPTDMYAKEVYMPANSVAIIELTLQKEIKISPTPTPTPLTTPTIDTGGFGRKSPQGNTVPLQPSSVQQKAPTEMQVTQ
jgi:hypothetical protein